MTGKKKIPYEGILLVVIVSAIWSISCALKGVYPFGDKVLSIGDMSEQSIPFYTFLWDVMHGQKSLFFDWDIGLGNNMAGVVSHFTLISPFNLFLLLIKRPAVETSMFYFFLCKIIAIALGVRFVFRKWFPRLCTSFLCAFCVFYTFCPFLVEYYRVPSWYDIAFLFPFLMYFYVEMMKGRGRGAGYTLCLAAMGIMSFQHTFMLVILLVLMTGGLLVIDKDRYGSLMSRWIGTSVLAAMLSACVLLPGMLQIMTAGRLGENFHLVEIMKSIYIFYPAKWSKLVNLGIPFGMILCGCRDSWKKKDFRGLLYMDILLLLPIGLESTNMLWHGGPYEGYTMRFSYMLTFWVLVTGLYVYDRKRGEQPKDAEEKTAKGWVKIVLLVVLLLMGMVLYHMAGLKPSIVWIVLVVMLSMVMGAAVFCMEDTKYVGGVLIVAVMVSMSIFGQNIITQYNTDDSGVWFYNTVREEEKEYERPALDRIKNLDICSQSYPQLMNRSAIGNYTASEGYEQIYSVVDMGYALVGNRMSDWGGTVFSDAVIGVTEVFTTREAEPDSRLYSEKVTEEDYRIYDCNYRFNDGILIRQTWDESVKGNGNPFALQNEMAQSILNEQLFKVYETSTDVLQIEVAEESILYGYVPGVPNPEIIVDALEIRDMETGELTQRKILSGWDNGIVDLGIYQGQELCIRVEKAKDIDTMYFALLPVEKLREYEPVYAGSFQYTASKHSLEATLTDAAEGDKILLPVYHDEGWKCQVNGKSVRIETFLSGGMVIPLAEGNNEIRLQYSPTGLKAGILCSIAGGIFFMILWRWPKAEEIITKKTNRLAGRLTLGVWGIMMMILYLVPIVFMVEFLIKYTLSIITS